MKDELTKREEIIELYDIYSSLLTNKQKEYFEQYYFDDFSLAEIASNYDVSRNAVFDQIKKTISILNNYEANLKIAKKNLDIKKALELNNLELIKEKIAKIIEE